MQTLTPNIAVIGFGMAGIAFTNALRHAESFAADASRWAPRITVFESMPRVGGKMAPLNMGAQFIDERNFYPVYGPNGLVERLALKTYAPRPDYDICDYVGRSGSVLRGERFMECLSILRDSARQALRDVPWRDLDQASALDFIADHLKRGIFSALDAEAMAARLGFEEGTCDISLLSWAINLVKSDSPMRRLELVGGFHGLAEAERRELSAAGHLILTDTAVERVEVTEKCVLVGFKHGGPDREAVFDHALLAVAPEHYGKIAIRGAKIPWKTISCLKPAAITKTNLRFSGISPEIATPRFAKWNDAGGKTSDETRVNFFHGWEGERALTEREIIAHAAGGNPSGGVAFYRSQTWDGSPVEGTPHAYTTMPRPGLGFEVVNLALKLYCDGTYDGERLRFANQVLGLGCYTRDSALSGEWAAVSLMRSLGLDVSRADSLDPLRLFTGMERDAVLAQILSLSEAREKRVS
jgi:hypothetical protein